MSTPIKGHRIVQGLVWARPCARPQGIPISRPRGAKQAGLRYERLLASALGENAIHGQWFEFMDANGHGYCQVDLMLRTQQEIVLLEAKYTWTMRGHRQLEQLYLPVVTKALNRPCVGIVVCKKLIPGMPMAATGDLGIAIAGARHGIRTVMHWIGATKTIYLREAA